MTTSFHAFSLFGASRTVRAAADSAGTLAAGAVVSLVPKAAMTLRIAEGHAWVTQGTGDVFLCAGQSLEVVPGQRLVIESLGGRRLQYRWTRGDAACPASWWRRASFGSSAAAHGAWGDVCCA